MKYDTSRSHEYNTFEKRKSMYHKAVTSNGWKSVYGDDDSFEDAIKIIVDEEKRLMLAVGFAGMSGLKNGIRALRIEFFGDDVDFTMFDFLKKQKISKLDAYFDFFGTKWHTNRGVILAKDFEL